jgi:glycosyltransferase involved in cell wall biosynthesis
MMNADRLLNRFWDYPRYLRRHVTEFDWFHVADHSYAQLVHELPAERTGVYCHDLDSFRCLLEPQSEPRPRWFRAMSRRILHGLQKAAVVFHSTHEVGRQIETYGLIDPDRLVLAPYGTAPEFVADPMEPHGTGNDLPSTLHPYLLHVGSCIPRKRIDVLLDVFAAVRARHPQLRLVQIGGSFSRAQRERIGKLQLASAVTQVRGLERRQLAAFYRRARLVLQPSEAEGFGLPVIEALSCGSIVIASDIPTLREAGGDAVVYCKVADVEAWTDTICRILENATLAAARFVRLEQGRKFSWAAQARTIFQAYQSLPSRALPSDACQDRHLSDAS